MKISKCKIPVRCSSVISTWLGAYGAFSYWVLKPSVNCSTKTYTSLIWTNYCPRVCPGDIFPVRLTCIVRITFLLFPISWVGLPSFILYRIKPAFRLPNTQTILSMLTLTRKRSSFNQNSLISWDNIIWPKNESQTISCDKLNLNSLFVWK